MVSHFIYRRRMKDVRMRDASVGAPSLADICAGGVFGRRVVRAAESATWSSTFATETPFTANNPASPFRPRALSAFMASG